MINYRHGIFICDNFYEILKVKTGMVYNVLVQNRFVPQTLRKTFSEKFDVCEKDWPKIYPLPGKCSKDSRTRIFQHKNCSWRTCSSKDKRSFAEVGL